MSPPAAQAAHHSATRTRDPAAARPPAPRRALASLRHGELLGVPRLQHPPALPNGAPRPRQALSPAALAGPLFPRSSCSARHCFPSAAQKGMARAARPSPLRPRASADTSPPAAPRCPWPRLPHPPWPCGSEQAVPAPGPKRPPAALGRVTNRAPAPVSPAALPEARRAPQGLGPRQPQHGHR